MIIPISHEDQRGRRWPYITITVILFNILFFLLTNGAIERQNAEYMQKTREALAYYLAHPYLTPGPPLDRLLSQINQSSRKNRLTAESLKQLGEGQMETGGGDPIIRAAQQGELDALCTDMRVVESASPLKRYAYIPVENNLLGLITYQFLHGGWLHLIGNMFFLWLAGCNIEDRWGRAIFPAFYISSGIAAGLAHKLAGPQSLAPLIGASGAIAGVMGAFLIKFAKTRIKFLVILFFRPRFFTAPAYLMLPLWLLVQVFSGVVSSSMGGVGVAFWAHVGGFLYGVLFAVVIGLTGIDAWIDKGIKSQISLEQAPEVISAGEMIDAGRPLDAINLLEQFAAKQPRHIDAQLELLRAAKAVPDPVREQRAYVRLIGLYLQQNAPDTAISLYEEMHALGMETEVPAPLRLRLARHLEKNEFLEGAAEEYLNIYSNSAADTTSFQALLAHANLLVRMGKKQEALQLYTIAHNSPVPHLDWETTILHGIKKAKELPD